jgi:hypothetical protein
MIEFVSVSSPPFAVIRPVATVVELFVTAPECMTAPENVPPVAGTESDTENVCAASTITTSSADKAGDSPVMLFPVVAVKSDS